MLIIGVWIDMKKNPVRVLSYQDLFEGIMGIESGEEKAFVSLLYLTGARVSEIVKTIRAGDVEVFQDDGVQYLKVRNMPILKRRDKEATRHPEILLKGKEKVLAENVITHCRASKGVLFDISRRTGYNWVHKHTGFYPHYLRHARTTHLAEYADFDPADLQKFIGWANLNMAGRYTHLSMKKLRHKLRESRFVG